MGPNITSCADQLIGSVPDIDGCRGGFDFSLAFQDVILSVLPSTIFLVCAIPRAVYLHRQNKKTRRATTYTPKLIVACGLFVLNIILLALTCSVKLLNTQYSVASAALALLTASFIIHLSDTEHVKSIRPSFLITAYLVPTILFDAARVRTEWLLSVNTAYAAILSVALTTKVALLSFETVEKRRSLVKQDKLPSTESTSGPLSRGFFVWLNSLFLRGWKGSLTLQDLPAINEKLDSHLLTVRFSSKWEKALKGGKKPNIFFVTVDSVKWHLASIVPPRLAMIGLVICRPFMVSQMLKYLNSPDGEVRDNIGYGLIGAFALVFTGSAIVQAWYEHLSYRVGAMIRGSLITAIYSKMIKLPASQLAESSAVTLMGNDVETMIEKLNMLLVEWWANAFTVFVAMYLLYAQMGAVCVAPIVVAIAALSSSSLVGKAMIGRLKFYQQAQQLRINFTSQVVSSIKSVKMLGYVDRFTDLIRQRRVNDIKAGVQFRWLITLSNMVTNMTSNQTLTVTFGAYAIVAKLSGNEAFSASQATVVLSILNVMMEPLTNLLGNITNALSTFASFGRIEKFLLLEEVTDDRLYARNQSGRSSESSGEKPTSQPGKPATMKPKITEINDGIRLENSDFNWSATDPALTGIDTHFTASPQGSLTTIIGPIGSGKSTLLKSILGETRITHGSISLDTPLISFCDQTPWLMNATIRDNIVGESGDFDEQWLHTVVEACDLKTDLTRLPRGDQTVVGDKGLKLSGGQKQRMAIARAVYARKSVAIFDDVFSGLDKVTERVVFDGVFASGGLLRKNGTTVIMATHAVNRLVESDYIIALDAGGKIVEQGTYAQLAVNGGYVSQHKQSEAAQDHPIRDDNAELDAEEQIQEVKQVVLDMEEAVTPPSDRSIFKYYLKAVSRWNLVTFCFLCAGMETCSVLQYVWLTWWGEGRGGHDSSNLGYWLGLFAMITIIHDLCISGGIAYFLIIIGPRVSLRLHHVLLKAVMEAPMSFLSGSDAGSLINRFSQDLRLIDIDLNVSFGVFVFNLASCFGAAGLATAAIHWFALAIPFVLAVVITVQRFYVRTSKQLRILEIEHKAPLYSHFLETISGIVTIRSFGWKRAYAKKNIRLLDDAQKPSYLMSCIQIWLKLVLDLCVACLTILLVVLAVTLRGVFPPALLGMAIVNMMNLNTHLKAIIVAWSQLETSLGAVARIKNFAETTDSEISAETERMPAAEWPRKGALELQNVVMRYGPDAEPVLRNLSLDIKPGERVGFCGRSGSGKSSTIQAILRMTDISSGKIVIDGEDTSELPRNLVRAKMSCLTQDAFLFNETVRFNMDPTQDHQDEEIVSALKRIGLWSVIEGKTQEVGKELEETMDETYLSHGQKQLFCLGRALLKPSSFLILDEPTSNVDNNTDAQMQEVIRSEFRNRTIIMIAHRLHTLLDFDKIVVLDKGEIVEFGKPDALLKKGGAFAKLYRADSSKKSGPPSWEIQEGSEC